jgi:uncharacterized membrane protein
MIRGVSRALGWFSAGLGAVQLIAPGRLLAACGIAPTGGRRVLTRIIGVRELLVVPGLLTGSRPFGWLAARVAGDAMDVVLLTRALRARDTRTGTVMTVLGAVVGVTLVDIAATIAARRASRERSRHPDTIVRTVTVNRPVAELYRFWRDVENLPSVMPHLESVEARGGSMSHWVARAPLGTSVEWDAEITEDRPDELVAWRSVEGSQVRNAGSVRFAPAPGQRGTEVRVEMEYDTPGGPLGTVVAMLSGEEPRQQVADALRRFKQVMETGEPIVSEATVTGRKIMQRPAQPLDGDGRERQLPVAAGAAGEMS